MSGLPIWLAPYVDAGVISDREAEEVLHRPASVELQIVIAKMHLWALEQERLGIKLPVEQPPPGKILVVCIGA
jgi:hypothetical protein